MSEETKNLQQEEKEQDVNALRQIRVEKLEAMQEAGNDPFQIVKYPVDTHTDEIREKYDAIDADNIDRILQDEIGIVFKEILECAGVYKRDEKGKAAFLRFVDAVNQNQKEKAYV